MDASKSHPEICSLLMSATYRIACGTMSTEEAWQRFERDIWLSNGVRRSIGWAPFEAVSKEAFLEHVNQHVASAAAFAEYHAREDARENEIRHVPAHIERKARALRAIR